MVSPKTPRAKVQPPYDPSFVEKVIALGAEGFVREQIAMELKLTPPQLTAMAKIHKEFHAALREAQALAIKFHRSKGTFGRPTKYKPEYCQTVIEMGRGNPEEGFAGGGFSLAQIARQLDVAKDTLNEWAEVHPDFSVALKRAVDLSEAWWEDKAHGGIDVQGFNGGLWKVVMSARFPKTYREPSRVEMTGKDGEPLVPTSSNTQVVLTPELMKELMAEADKAI